MLRLMRSRGAHGSAFLQQGAAAASACPCRRARRGRPGSRLPGFAAPSAARRPVRARSRAPAGSLALAQHSARASSASSSDAVLVANAAELREQRVLRADARVVEARRHRVRFLDLPVARPAAASRNCHAARPDGRRRGSPNSRRARAASARLDADDLDCRIGEERMEHADGVGASADAGDDRIGQARRPAPASARALRGR